MNDRPIVVVNCGGQTAHLVTSRFRTLGFAVRFVGARARVDSFADAAGVVLSGGPRSVYEPGSPQPDPAILSLGKPVLGLCYGHQWIAHQAGGTVKRGSIGEYGRAKVWVNQTCGLLLADLEGVFPVWMSHGDTVTAVPPGYLSAAWSQECEIAAMVKEEGQIFSLQFHPEVSHTAHGDTMLRRFAELSGASSWSLEEYVVSLREAVQQHVGTDSVLMLASGGVDSTVAVRWLQDLLGPDRVTAFLIDTGLLRQNEVNTCLANFARAGITDVVVIEAAAEFLAALQGVRDPQAKRRIFIKGYERVALATWQERRTRDERREKLGQGTLYPDYIESGGAKDEEADEIKEHHNLGPTMKVLKAEGNLVEPWLGLYKNEVRIIGADLGIPADILKRRPYPGPGLAIRILCGEEELQGNEEQLPGVSVPHRILPIRSVGVQGDGRTYRQAVVLYPERECEVTEAHWQLATDIPNRVPTINRVLVCLSSTAPQPLVVTPEDVTPERVSLLREADALVEKLIQQWGELDDDIWQFPVVLLPVGLTPGGQSIVLRPVRSVNAMTAEAARLPQALLKFLSKGLLALPGRIQMVFYDLSSKPPATIEWE